MMEGTNSTFHNVTSLLGKCHMEPWGAWEIKTGTARIFNSRKKKNVEEINRPRAFTVVLTMEW